MFVKKFTLFIFLLTSCYKEQEIKESQSVNTEEMFKILGKIVYFKDKRAKDLCLGYIYQIDTSFPTNYRTGGPSMFSVDCEKVNHLLINTDENTHDNRP